MRTINEALASVNDFRTMMAQITKPINDKTVYFPNENRAARRAREREERQSSKRLAKI